jgi:hypothetical protein
MPEKTSNAFRMRKFQVLIFWSLIAWCSGQVPTVPTVGPTTTTEQITTTTTGTTTTAGTTTTRPPITIPTAGTLPGATTTILTTTNSPPPETFQCPPVGVHYFPTTHCQHFIVCINGNQQLGQCQDFYLFDAVRLNCEPAEVVNCGDRIRPEGVNKFIFRFWWY